MGAGESQSDWAYEKRRHAFIVQVNDGETGYATPVFRYDNIRIVGLERANEVEIAKAHGGGLGERPKEEIGLWLCL